MNLPTREELVRLREKYPAGSRIKLIAMNNDPNPIEPGSMGTLVNIDDIGTFHVKWDSGRFLGLAYGEDSFSVLPPEQASMKSERATQHEIQEGPQMGGMTLG